MKKISILLCFILCVSFCLPNMAMMTVGATEINSDLLNGIGEVLGTKGAALATGNSAMVLDFTDNFNGSTEGVTDVSSGVTYNQNGIVFPLASSNYAWRYRPHNGWSPLAATGNYGFRFKLNQTGEVQNVAYSNVDASGRTFMRFRENEIAIWEAGGTGFVRAELLADFSCGTDWIDVLVVENSKGGYDVYLKKAVDKSFIKIASTSTYRPGGDITSGFAFSAQGAYISYAASFEEAAPPVYHTVADVVGNPVATEYHFFFDENFDDTIHDGEYGFTASGVSYNENGIYLPSGAKWTFLPYKGWSPLKNTSVSSSNVASVMTFRAKLGTGTTTPLSVRCYSPLGGTGRVFLDLKTTESKFTVHTTTTNNNIAPGTEWAEYLLIQNNQGGVSLYVKSDSVTGGKWELSRETSDYRTGGSNTMGLQLVGGDAYVKDIKIYNLTGAVQESSTCPSGATTLYFEEEFSKENEYGNVKKAGGVVSQGTLNLNASVDGGAYYQVSNGAIPTGGYVEFRIRSNANAYCDFYSGTSHLYLSMGKFYGGARGTEGVNAFVGDGGNVYRTWRVVRNQDESYNVYTKLDDETVWLRVAEQLSGSESYDEPKLTITINDHMGDFKDGVASLDSLRIYGLAPNEAITLTDGYGTYFVEDGQAMTYKDTMGVMISGQKGSLMIAGYDEKRRLTDVEIKEVDGTKTPAFIIFDGDKKQDTVAIKVFLWDMQTMNRLAAHRQVFTDPSMVEGRIGLLFNNEKKLLDGEAAPVRVEGEEYLPISLVSELSGWSATQSGGIATLTGTDTLCVSVGTRDASFNDKKIELYQKPLEQDGEIFLSVADVTSILPIGEDVTPYGEGVALHGEYYDENTTFFNLINTLTGDPKTTRCFSWEAIPDYDNMVIEFAKGSALSNAIQKRADYKEEAVVYNYHVTNPETKVSYYDNMLFYHVNLEGLEPGTTYTYRIGDTKKNVWSPSYTFVTEGNSKSGFSVIALADTQGINANDFSYSRRTIQAALQECNDPAFVMNLGDITENAMCDDWWNMYFEATESFSKTVPSVTVVGNHETRASGLKYYNLHFRNPQNGLGLATGYDTSLVNKYDVEVLKELDNTVYSFDYGDVHFAVLNTGSDWMKTTHVIDLQTEWLKEDMKNTDKKWKVVLMHIPIYPATTNGNVIPDHLYAVMDECDVDMVLSGHDHITLRTKPLKGNQPYMGGDAGKVSHKNGTVYSILGCAGIGRQKFESLPSDDWVEVVKETAWNNPTYNIISFDADSISVLSKALDGTVLDRYVLTK